MRKNTFFLSIGFWLLLAVKDINFLFIIFIVGLILFYKLNTKYIFIFLIWIFLCLMSVCFYNLHDTIPKPGIYDVDEIKKNYVIASDHTSKVILYDVDDVDYGDRYEIKDFKRIHSLNNISLFSFEYYLKESNIAYQGIVKKDALKEKGHSIRSDIYRFIRTHSLSLQGFLYGIYQEDIPDFLLHLSLPLIALFYHFEKFVKRFLSSSMTKLLMVILGLLSGLLFVFTVSLCRYICQKLSRYFFDDWEYQFACTTFLSLILMPQQAVSFGFVLPSLFSLSLVLCPTSSRRNGLRKLILFGLSFLYFKKIDFVSFFCFSWMRKWSGVVLILACMGLWIPALDISIYWYNFIEAVPSLEWYYDAGMIFLLLCLIACVSICYYRRKVMTIFLILLELACPFILPYCDPFFRVTVFSIGQADCTLITEPFFKSAVLIDCGENIMRPENMEKVVIPYLKLKHIDHLNAVILTHEDYDHNGGIETLQENLEIESIVRDSSQKINVSYPFYSLLEDRNATNENDKSVVSYFVYDNLRYLWMGDASVTIEKQMLHQYPELKADILKLGHHGSKTSSSIDFLYHINPNIALISSGKNNRYAHPDLEVLKNLQETGIHALNTAEVGMIQIASFHGLHFFRTGNYIFGIIGAVI